MQIPVENPTIGLFRRWVGTVYVVRFGGVVKIGITEFLSNRLRQLQQATGAPPELLATIESYDPIRPRRIERELQQRFAHLKLHGEWFRNDPEFDAWAKREQGSRR